MTSYDLFMGALGVWREGRGASPAGKAGIWAVILNRVADPRFPDTVPEVLLQHAQFSSFGAGDPNAVLFPVASHWIDWKSFLECQTVVSTPLLADPTGGATHYHSIPDVGFSYRDSSGRLHTLMPPAWADPTKLTATIGPFRFYKP